VQLVVVGAAHRVREQPVAHEAAVDEEVLQVGAAARRFRAADAAGQASGPAAAAARGWRR
jgi:hypothetical protein